MSIKENKMNPVILIVDDSTSVRKMVETALRFKQYVVVAATNGLEALEALSKNNFDLAIFDVNMPQMDGLSLLKSVREEAKWDDMPILMLTTEGEEQDLERAKKLGANSYMRKPFKPNRLLQRVASLLSSRK